MGQQPHDGTRMEELQLHTPRSIQTKEAAGHPEEAQGPVQARVIAVCSSLLWPAVGWVRSVEGQRQGPCPLGAYGPIALEHSICSIRGKHGHTDTEETLKRGSGKTFWKRGPWHESHRSTGGGLEERV